MHRSGPSLASDPPSAGHHQGTATARARAYNTGIASHSHPLRLLDHLYPQLRRSGCRVPQPQLIHPLSKQLPLATGLVTVVLDYSTLSVSVVADSRLAAPCGQPRPVIYSPGWSRPAATSPVKEQPSRAFSKGHCMCVIFLVSRIVAVYSKSHALPLLTGRPARPISAASRAEAAPLDGYTYRHTTQ